MRLFEEWKAQNLRCKEMVQRYEEVRAKVMEGLGPCWELVGVKGEPYRAVFISSWHNDTTQKIVPLKVRSFLDARNKALKVQASLNAEH